MAISLVLESYAAGWALVDGAPTPTERNLIDLLALDGLGIDEALSAGERQARRASLELARDRLYGHHSKTIAAAAAAALLAHVDVEHLARSLVLMGNLTRKHRRDQLLSTLSGAAWAAGALRKTWTDANAEAWAAAVARGKAEAMASTVAGPPLPRTVAELTKSVSADIDPTDAPDWIADQLGRLAWHLSSAELVEHEDPAAFIRRQIEAGEPVTASAEDLMHEALSRAFVDWFHTGDGTNLGQLSWVSEGDSFVCDECDFNEAESPYPADATPDMPAHAACRCHFERE